MKRYTPAMSFGADVAADYRDATRGDENAAVEFLTGLTGDGAVLELAIGAGRIALPLVRRGVRLDGIDISQAMIDELKSLPDGDRIDVVLGDFADVPVSGTYRLIYIVWNSFFNLLTQNDQVRCFENVARHLDDDGSFVIEAFVPGFLHRLRNDQYVDAESIETDEVKLDVLRHDPATQTIDESHVTFSSDGVRLNPVVQRYAWPSELDLMARLAGLVLKERWGGFRREPFTAKSELHVSVYGH